jgi:GH15 family glucan-1,4-alpha-glucosidase
MYNAIHDYGLIGNMRTAALVSKQGSVDWLCLPRFDSPSIFAAILDDKIGGRFFIKPLQEDTVTKQYYWPSTNILVTQFMHADGVGELQDYMPIATSSDATFDQIIRRVRTARGVMKFRMHCAPAFDYARAPHQTRIVQDSAVFSTPQLTISLATTVKPLQIVANAAVAEFTLNEGEEAIFVLRLVPSDADISGCPHAAEAEDRFRGTVNFWQSWVSKCTYRGRWRETVERSALVLKLMTYEPTGAVIAAPTTSLPETMGGVRNWDYRYVWIRDASFTLYALLRIGFKSEAVAFMQWLMDRLETLEGREDGPLRVLYTVDGKPEVPEEILSHLDGYCGSKPVRIGNAADDQLQLDIYGELMDSVYLFNKHASPVGYDQWLRLRSLLEWLESNWDRPDEGLWEVRGGRQPFLYSKLMAWVAFDRGLRLAEKRSFPANRGKWLEVRDAIYTQVMEKGWSKERSSFVQAYGSTNLDASSLIMPLVFFTAANDPRMLATIDAINSPVSRGGLVSNGMVYRYNTETTRDGLFGEEGTFNMCSFWLVEALTRAGALEPERIDDARLLFEHMLANSNHLGLYSEQTGPSGQALGNYPQAFTHLALISAAFNLDRVLGSKKP